mmetsp:Transcript_27212/g.69293  ORF Transcript_27212/g.69293 Transcript_27212/m.69293 type:complete len:276 (-) Transcript_27212:11-838(-)
MCLARNSSMSLSSAPHAEWPMPWYVAKSTSAPSCASLEWVARPNWYATTWSASPWHMSTGVALLASDSTTGALARGRYVDRPSTAPSLVGARSMSSATAPPWLKPPTTTRCAGTPAATSLATSSSTNRMLSCRPASSSFWLMSSSDAMSYHPGICMPQLRVMGRRGACGKMKRMFFMRPDSWPATSAHPSPLSPNPCRKIMDAVACPLAGGITIGFSYFKADAITDDLFAHLGEFAPAGDAQNALALLLAPTHALRPSSIRTTHSTNLTLMEARG